MMRHCDGKDPNLIARNTDSGKFEPCACGARFDDAECSVIYPHHLVRVLTDEERVSIDELIKAANERAERTGDRYPGNKRIREEP